MFTITVLMRENGHLILVYDAEKRAAEDFGRLSALRAQLSENSAEVPSIILLVDDFGTRSEVDAIDISVVTCQEVKRINDGQVELQLAQARAQAQFNTRAASDPALKFMSGARGGGLMG